MPKFRVHFETGASATVTVEAEDSDEAIDLAYDEVPSGVCAQCSGWGRNYSLDLGQFELADKDPQYPHVELVEGDTTDDR